MDVLQPFYHRLNALSMGFPLLFIIMRVNHEYGWRNTRFAEDLGLGEFVEYAIEDRFAGFEQPSELGHSKDE